MGRPVRILVPLACVYLLALAGWIPRQPPAACNIRCTFEHLDKALAAHRYGEYLSYARNAVARAPDFPWSLYVLAKAYAYTGQRAAALRQLQRLADIGGTQDPAPDSAFLGMRRTPGFPAVLIRLAQNRKPVVRGALAFSLPDPDLLPEALASDPRTGGWLIGSLAHRKVVRFTPGGTISDFVAGPTLLRVVGIHVDSLRSLLWFATWAPRTNGPPQGQEAPSDTRLFKCDLATGRIIREYAPPDSGASHLFNDLALAANGDVFITDTEKGWIYRVGQAEDSLEVFLRPDSIHFTAANGITLSPNQRTLYVGYLEGIARIDIRTRTIARLAAPGGASTSGVDGLYWYKGSLVAVQHRPGLDQVARFQLSPDGQAIIRGEVLERGSEILSLPTTGSVVGDRFYYIATSHYDRLGDDNRLAAPGSPSERSTVRVIDLARP